MRKIAIVVRSPVPLADAGEKQFPRLETNRQLAAFSILSRNVVAPPIATV
jgi:hypothetical protein